MIRWLTDRINAVLNWFAPLSVLDVLGSQWADEMAEWELAEWEEHHEVFEPDELWAATNLPANGGSTGHVSDRVPPTGTVPPGAGGLPPFPPQG